MLLLEPHLVLVVLKLVLWLLLVRLVHVTVLTHMNAVPQLSEIVLASSKFLSPAIQLSWTARSGTATTATLTLTGVTIFTLMLAMMMDLES